jgi:hypothetical protein
MTRWKTALLAVILVLAFSAAAASSASAQQPKELYGVVPWTTPSAKDFTRLKQANVGIYRMTFLWPVVEFKRGARNWFPYDQIFRRVASAGMRVLPTVVGSPRFAARKFQYPPRSRGNQRAWGRFLTAAAKRYGVGGEFWARNPGIPYLPIKWWQVWNEPNFRAYWFNKPRPRAYASFLKLSYKALKRGDPTAHILLAGLPDTRLGIRGSRYLPLLYRAHARRYFDGVALHAYSKDARGVMALVRKERRIMARYGDSAKPLFVTEVGWATGGPVSGGTRRFKTTLRGQANKLRSTFSALTRARLRYKIGAILWFSWRDRRTFKGERRWWAIYTGLISRRGKAKPAFRALRAFTLNTVPGDPLTPAGAAPLAPPAALPPSSGGGGGGGNTGGGGGGGGCLIAPVPCP